MRLIDADAFLKSEIERCGCVPVIGSCTADNEIFKFVLEQQPTVEPVRGEWKVKTKSNNGYTVSITCSACGYSHSRVMYNFCPECGADMRKGGVNNV